MDIQKLHQRIAETEALREGWEALQDSLTTQGQLLHYLTEFAPAAVAMLDTQLRYVLVSLRWKQFFQLENRALIELPFADSFEDKPKLLSVHLRLGLQGRFLPARNMSLKGRMAASTGSAGKFIPGTTSVAKSAVW
ncbi:MAG: hypothetical protein R3B47_04830 [Bacteroidia bacterium]